MVYKPYQYSYCVKKKKKPKSPQFSTITWKNKMKLIGSKIKKGLKKYETCYNSDINTMLNHHLFIILSYKHMKAENLQAHVQ